MRRVLLAGQLVVVSVSIAAALGYGVFRVLTRPAPKSSARGPVEASSVTPEGAAPANQAPAEAADPVQVSAHIVDFGVVALHSPARQTLYLLNGSGGKVRVARLDLKPPFETEQTSLDLEPDVPTEVGIKFDPQAPGAYEQRLTLSLGRPLDRKLEVVVRGEGVLSPADAGVPIPPPPDLIVRQYREKEIARLAAEAREASRPGTPESDTGPSASRGGEAGEGGAAAAKERRAGGDSSPTGAADSPPIPFPALVAAFGVVQGQADDLNNKPVPIPAGDTKPDLPSAKQGGGTGGGSEKKDGSGESDGGDGKGGGDQEQADSNAKKIPTFTVAPNSSVLVYSSKETLDLQAFPLRTSSDGSVFEIDGRIRFPELALAFGESVSVHQWGNIAGTVTPDGQVEMKMVLRIDDPSKVVLDLPVTLTTGMVVGYSAEGRVMFANGVPRDPATGDLKLVGITNIPLGVGSALDKAPVFVEMLGRLAL